MQTILDTLIHRRGWKLEPDPPPPEPEPDPPPPEPPPEPEPPTEPEPYPEETAEYRAWKVGIERRLRLTGLRPLAAALRHQIRKRMLLQAESKGEDGPRDDRERSMAEMWASAETSVMFVEALQSDVARRIRELQEELRIEKTHTININAKAFQEALEKAMGPPPRFVGYVGSINDILDPNYTETDPGKRIRDSWLWVGFEFRRITVDEAKGYTTQDFSKASTPPPTPLAVMIAEEYAQCPPGSRRDLFTRLIGFAEKGHATPTDIERRAPISEGDAYLDSLGVL
jgi:hypothetical protein